MIEMLHVMLDCESFGLRNTSAICTIGAVQFDPYTVSPLGLEFHESIDLQSSISHGLTMDPSTVLWWLGQRTQAQQSLLDKLNAASSLSTVLNALTSWLRVVGEKSQVTPWSCGSRDFEWLEASYAAVKTPVPWHYRVRDYRTIREEFGTPGDQPPDDQSHNALADAKWQAKYLQNVFARLRTQADQSNRWTQLQQGDPLSGIDLRVGVVSKQDQFDG